MNGLEWRPKQLKQTRQHKRFGACIYPILNPICQQKHPKRAKPMLVVSYTPRPDATKLVIANARARNTSHSVAPSIAECPTVGPPPDR